MLIGGKHNIKTFVKTRINVLVLVSSNNTPAINIMFAVS